MRFGAVVLVGLLVAGGLGPGSGAWPAVGGGSPPIPLPGSAAAGESPAVLPRAAPTPTHSVPDRPAGREMFPHSPASWRGASLPPGAEALSGLRARDHFGNLSHPTDPHGECYGVWPTEGGQSTYTNDCYGHDEPGINFYSTMRGSGGNVSWNITLPVSRNASATQSDLYTAIWFGMTLSDPYAWMDQCFLELQFYPDSDWNVAGSAYGSWVGAAVAWQIEASTGFEDACFYEVLSQAGNPYNEFLMTQGDRIGVTMTGWVGDPYGENLTLHDWTNGEVSNVTLYNSAQGYPIDPAYPTASWPNSLQWTPGGEMPVVFAFETGHTTYPYPNTNGYGGCSSGPPPSSAADPAVPCPSYDPGSWTNDTVTPWEISVPTFFNATAVEVPAQVSFTQDFGGISFIDPLSNYTCSGRDGSAFCSYPWYSFSCRAQAFEFGATDYRFTSVDFGGYLEYAQTYATDSMGLGFVPPTNFSIPTCGRPSYEVTAGPTGGGGSAYFLSTAVVAPRPFPTVGPGEYALAALPREGKYFTGWTTNGSVAVADPSDPFTTLWVSGNGSVVPQFGSAPPTNITLTIRTSLSGGSVVVSPSLFLVNGPALGTRTSGGTFSVAPGWYSIQAAAPSGYNFSHWAVAGDGARVAAPYFPYTWLDVPAASAGITLTAISVSASVSSTILYSVWYGSGSVSFNGGTATTSGSAVVSVGTYSLVATPSAGWAFEDWYVGSSAVLLDQGASTNVTLETGTAYVYAYFEALVQVRTSPAASGAVSVSSGAPSASTDVFLYPGYYTLTPAPAAGYAFAGWTVSSSTALWAYPVAGGGYWIEVNASGTLTAKFTTASPVNLSFASNVGAGGVGFNFVDYAPLSENTTLADGTYSISPLPAPGYNFTGWSTSGAVSVTSGGFAKVTGAGGVLTADYAVARYPVTVTTDPPGGATVSLGALIGGGPSLGSGETIWLSGGPDYAVANLPGGISVVRWASSPNLQATGNATATLMVGGPGTLTAFLGGFLLSAAVGPAHPIDLGQTLTATATVTGGGAFTYAWTGLPPGCTALDLAQITCAPSATGNYSVSVRVDSSDGSTHTALAGTVSVVPRLGVQSFTASPANLTLGVTSVLSVATGGGVPPLSYEYSGLPAACPSLDAPRLSCAPPTVGSFAVTVRIADLTGLLAFGYLALLVAPTPVIGALNESPPVTDVGQSVLWGVWAVGGTLPFHFAYTGLPPGCVDTDAASLRCAPSGPGNFTVSVTATDADGIAAMAHRELSVFADPQVVGVAVSPTPAVVNASVRIVTTLEGGSGPLALTLAGLPPGCEGRSSPDFTCVPTAVGSYRLQASVSDRLVLSAPFTAWLNVTAGAPPAGSGGNSSGGLGDAAGVPTLELLATVGGVAVAVVAIVLWARRRSLGRPPTDETSPEGEGGTDEGSVGPPAE